MANCQYCFGYNMPQGKGSSRYNVAWHVNWLPVQVHETKMSVAAVVDVCGNDFLVPISFPLPSNHSHSHPFSLQHCIPIFTITSISIPTHSHSHFRQQLYIDYLKAEKFKTK